MRRSACGIAAIVCALLWTVTCAEIAVAQNRRTTRTASKTRNSGSAKGSQLVRIRDFDGLGRQTKIKTPSFRTDHSGGVKPASDWIRLRVKYDTAEKWIDELTFKFHAVSLSREKGKLAYSSYSKTVTYLDIEQGKNHYGTMFLRPQAVRRYGDVVAAAVEIVHEGKVIAVESSQPSSFAAEWWNRMGQAGAEIRPGYMLDRTESPFALINKDDH
jgi:hypothetical protein